MALSPLMSASFSAQLLSPVSRQRVSLGFNQPCSLIVSTPCLSRSLAISPSHCRRLCSAAARNKKKTRKKQVVPDSPLGEDEDLDDDAFEALFKLLEEDLKNDDDLSFDDDDLEISEEDFARLESDLKEALGVDEDIEVLDATVDSVEGDSDDPEAVDDVVEQVDNVEGADDDAEEVDDDVEQVDDDDDENDEMPVELKRWQLRRLASALKAGRRKTSIKSLASELGLDRSIVLELLRDPPPHLLLMSATLPDETEYKELVPPSEALEVVEDKAIEAPEVGTKVEAPLHVMHQRWSAQKRLKKAQIQTLENVYRKTKRPTNAMISSIVQVTSLPRKRIVKWFEDRRAEDGVPDQRIPYQRPEPETASRY